MDRPTSPSVASYLLRIHAPGRPPTELRPSAARLRIGRDAGDVVLGDPRASALHCEVEFEGGIVTVRDLGSSNGTWFRGRPQAQFALAEGESFQVGDTRVELAEVSGPDKLVAGRTLMAEGHQLSEMLAAEAQRRSGGPAPAGGAPAPAPPKRRVGLVVGLAAGLVLALAGGGAALYLWSGHEGGRFAFGGARDVAQSAPDGPTSSAGREGTGGPDTGVTGTTGADPGPPSDPDDDPAGEPADKDLRQIYREVGAATVVVRAPGSVGSGAIISADGLVLTNHHVIDGGRRAGLKLEVDVVRGRFNEALRAFEPDPEHLVAHVVSYDEDLDLALLQIEADIGELPHVTVSPEPPQPGQAVAAIGHAGAGMLWAIKGGEISATGSLTGHVDLQVQADELRGDLVDRMRQPWLRKGRTIQSTAKILPGDSGGPLVDIKGRLVGVNAFGKLDERTNQWLSFHVHHEEVVRFLAEIPRRPMDVFPDPYRIARDGGVRLEDLDGDGRAETLLFPGVPGGARAVLLDLDQRGDLATSTSKARVEALARERDFPAQFAAVIEPGGRHHSWYDRDGDGRFDLYVVDEGGRGVDLRSYQLSQDAPARLLSGAVVREPFDAAPLAHRDRERRFRAVIPKIFDHVSPTGAPARPLPWAVGDAELARHDHDGDGRRETVEQRELTHVRAFWDIDQDRLPGLEGGKLGQALRAGEAGAEVVAVVQGSRAWVWYDTEGDGRLDLLLHARDAASGVASAAYRLRGDEAEGEGEAGTPAPEFLGRRLIRADLYEGEAAARLVRAAGRLLDAHALTPAEGDSLASFPGLRWSSYAHIQAGEVDGKAHAMARVTDRGYEISLFDLDHDSFDDPAAVSVSAAAAAVKAGRYDAEIAVVTRGDLTWTYWDTDGDGTYDQVRYAGLGTDRATAGYRRAGAHFELDPAAEGKPVFDPALAGTARAELTAALAAWRKG